MFEFFFSYKKLGRERGRCIETEIKSYKFKVFIIMVFRAELTRNVGEKLSRIIRVSLGVLIKYMNRKPPEIMT